MNLRTSGHLLEGVHGLVASNEPGAESNASGCLQLVSSEHPHLKNGGIKNLLETTFCVYESVHLDSCISQ